MTALMTQAEWSKLEKERYNLYFYNKMPDRWTWKEKIEYREREKLFRKAEIERIKSFLGVTK